MSTTTTQNDEATIEPTTNERVDNIVVKSQFEILSREIAANGGSLKEWITTAVHAGQASALAGVLHGVAEHETAGRRQGTV